VIERAVLHHHEDDVLDLRYALILRLVVGRGNVAPRPYAPAMPVKSPRRETVIEDPPMCETFRALPDCSSVIPFPLSDRVL